MSWLSDLTDSIGLTGGKETNSNGNASGSSASIWPSLISAGTQLAGTYFSLSNNKELNDANIKQRQAEMEAMAAKGGGGGGGGAGAALQIAKMNNLAALYQNWGALHAKAADTESGALIATGKMGQDPIIARANALR